MKRAGSENYFATMRHVLSAIMVAIFIGIGICACGQMAATARAAQHQIAVDISGTENYTVQNGDTGTLSLTGIDTDTGESLLSIKWYSDDNAIVSVTEDGTFTALTAGSVYIYAYATIGNETYSNTSSYGFTMYVQPDMTGVTLDKTSITRYIAGSVYGEEFDINVVSDIIFDEYDGYTTFVYASSNSSVKVSASLDNNVIKLYVYNKGTTTVTFTINGKEYKVKIKLYFIHMSRKGLLLEKGKSYKLAVKGTTANARWKTSNGSVARISSKGVVKAKRTGNVVITATIDGVKVGCAVSVVTPKIYNVIRTAKRIAKNSTYSQALRMQKGYYDCSSLVWRSYARYGVKFGASGYAPTAADLGKWCASYGKVLSKSFTDKQIQQMKFNAGDLMFETGAKNGRYKGIYHVEMFAGYVCYGFDSSGEPVLGSRWANRTDSYYSGGGMIARP